MTNSVRVLSREPCEKPEGLMKSQTFYMYYFAWCKKKITTQNSCYVKIY